MTPPTVGEWERYWTLIMYCGYWDRDQLGRRNYLCFCNNAIHNFLRSLPFNVYQMIYFHLWICHLSEIRFKIRTWAWGLYGFTQYQLCIFSITLPSMTLKRILGTGPNTGKWQKVNGKGIKSLSIIFTQYLPLRSTYANLIEKTLKEVPMTTLQVRLSQWFMIGDGNECYG